MSETTLDQIRHWRDRAAQGVVTPLTTVQIIRLCDAAERAETLEAEAADTSCWVPQALHDDLQAERDALAAQLTEVTRERDELLRQRNSYPSDFDPSLRQHERDVTEIVELRAALASLRVVVEAAKAFSAAWLRWSRSNAIGVNVVTIDAAHTLCEALDALHAAPPRR